MFIIYYITLIIFTSPVLIIKKNSEPNKEGNHRMGGTRRTGLQIERSWLELLIFLSMA